MTYADATQHWMALDPEQQARFYNIAAKSDHTAFEWFNHLVPDNLKDDPSEVAAFMDGGTVTQEVWVSDQGRASGHYEQITHDIPDKDVSRITSGQNGGEYTLDNTVMEDASANRSRGADNMTTEELESIEASNAAESQLIDGGEIVDSTLEPTAGALEAAEATTDVIGVAADVISDIVAPISGAVVAGTTVAKHCDNDQDALVYGGLAAAGGALICTTPPGAIALGVYCGVKLYWKACCALSDWANS